MKPLEVYNLHKQYQQGKQSIQAISGLSLSINAGEILAFLGANGAGKTTSIKIIAGLIQPDTGWVKIAGCNPHTNPQALRMLGTVMEGSRNLYWRLTAEENLEYFGVLKGINSSKARKQALRLLDQFGLMHKRKAPVKTLSRGMQQKLSIAVALVHKPKLLLLDEPTLGLDMEASESVKALVRQIASEGCAILLTTHQLDIAEEISDRVAIIQKGQIITEEPTKEIIKRFSGSSYIIKVEGELDLLQITKIETLGAIVESEQERIIYTGTKEGLYKVLAALEPLAILQVNQDKANLTQVFLKLLKQHSYV
ncbi:ABC transporter ATP-binding protein [Dulcicalothrix desertica PCC 7102]|uniref:ABC transporter ATP-binding protein n=1 Tax=Dulcicalothrix desertica PCC 7102 TaxID=232991 RepID=A0A3S1C468_9CYAN|nr:ABC transporter ATP-binding protein [Dulcicalothrix desertica]RUS95009.1 ABC transporter ATP-binding protein [Dulcicalothrix desertica PCC 7102]TWH51415.1 ABC-2 type transport system ATP-binding protein [Dulcicalothrix desertica PCC 7102]